jgi:hypothetical protein
MRHWVESGSSKDLSRLRDSFDEGLNALPLALLQNLGYDKIAATALVFMADVRKERSLET